VSLTFDLSVVNVTVTTPPQGAFIFRSLQLATIYYITHLKCLFTVVREEGGPKFIKVCHMTLPTPLKGKIIACWLVYLPRSTYVPNLKCVSGTRSIDMKGSQI